MSLEEAERLSSELMAIVGDPVRLLIIDILRERQDHSASVKQLWDALGDRGRPISRGAVQFHTKILVEAGVLVRGARRASVSLKLDCKRLREILEQSTVRVLRALGE